MDPRTNRRAGDRPVTPAAPAQRLQARRSPRVVLDAEIVLRRPGRSNYRVHVYDLSSEGCRIEFVDRRMLAETLWVKFDGLEAVPATVCWIREPVAGLEFSHPIHPAVFALLLTRLEGQRTAP